MLWQDLKQAVYAQKSSNVAKIKQFCIEEWAKIPPQHYGKLISRYRKHFVAVIAAKLVFHMGDRWVELLLSLSLLYVVLHMTM